MRNNFLKLTGFLIISLTCLESFAQTRTITGTVKDNKGEALTGVTILAKGTTNDFLMRDANASASGNART